MVLQRRRGRCPGEFAGRVGAFIAELSYQVVGYSAFLVPVVFVVMGWHYFWCKGMDAAYTKAVGAVLLFACVSSFLPCAFESPETGPRIPCRRLPRRTGRRVLSEDLNKTGSVILILTLTFLAVVLSTQFSLGRLFAVVGELLKDRWAAARLVEVARGTAPREAAPGRAEEAPRQGPEEAREKIAAAARAKKEAAPKARLKESPGPAPSRAAAMVGAAAAALKAASSRPTPARDQAPRSPVETPLPLPNRTRLRWNGKGGYTLPPLALLDAPKASVRSMNAN